MFTYRKAFLSFLAFSLFLNCSGDEKNGACDPLNPDCDDGLVCEEVEGGEHTCFAPLLIVGMVLDFSDESGIEGALVQAVDPNGSAVGTSGSSGSDGAYSLTVPATRDKEGNPVSGSCSLRSQAMGYQPFPTDIRPALPLDATGAMGEEDAWIFESSLTTIKLLPLPGGSTGLGAISGTILAENPAGILVVAESGGIGQTGFTDSEGNFTVFNLPAGTYAVSGYAAGIQLDPVTVTLSAGEEKDGIDLEESERSLSRVSGNVQIVEAPGGSLTSVVLAVESTFTPDAARGQVPPGLRAENVSGDFTIENVPDGKYVVLAAFENDGLVRDPDQTIGGTNIVHIEVPDPVTDTVTLSESFKVTEALAVIRPGADYPEAVSTPSPTFMWATAS